jgi:hypothetical protein
MRIILCGIFCCQELVEFIEEAYYKAAMKEMQVYWRHKCGHASVNDNPSAGDAVLATMNLFQKSVL